MAPLNCCSSPSSLQVLSIRRLREPSSVLIRLQIRPCQRRIVIATVFRGNTDKEKEVNSRINSNRSPDPFAGWSGKDEDDENSQGKAGNGGMLAAGFAGLLIFGGLTFAKLSFGSKFCRNSSCVGAKLQMKPLTTEEGMLISDDQNAEIAYDENEANSKSLDKEKRINDLNPVSETDINKDLAEDKHDIINHCGIPSTETLDLADDRIGSADSFHVTSHEGLQIESDASDDMKTLESQKTVFSFTSNSIDAIISAEQENSREYEGSSCKQLSISGTIQEANNHGGSQFNPEGLLENVNFVSEDLNDDGSQHVSPEQITSSNTISSSSMNSDSDISQNEALTFPTELINVQEEYISSETTVVDFSAPVYANNLSKKESNFIAYNRSNKDCSSESILQKSSPFSGVPAPSLVSSALQVPPGKIIVPAVVDLVQSQAFAALQVLKVIEANAQPGDLCTRREYARWLVFASSTLSRNPTLKLYPAMYIENSTELAFDDITSEDPDFSYIQGLAEAGIIFSKLSLSDTNGSFLQSQNPLLFYPESPVSRQDLVSWKMALERKQLPETEKNHIHQLSGFIDIEKIDSGAWPALLADLSSGEQGIIPLAFGYTRLFQPNKPVTKAQAAIALATGEAAEVVGEELARIEAESLAETAVNAHNALVAQVERELNASFERELAKERTKINDVEMLVENANMELERIRAEREEENSVLLRRQATVQSEMEILLRLRSEAEEQLHELMSNKAKISFEHERIERLRKETESENQLIVQLQYELEVEKKALSMARTWAEDEAKRAGDLARALEEARERWVNQGIKVIVDEDLRDDATAGLTWTAAGKKQPPVDETVSSGEVLVKKLNENAAEIKLKSSIVIENVIHSIATLISALKLQASEISKHATELQSRSVEALKEIAVIEKTRRVFDDCKERAEKISQKFKV